MPRTKPKEIATEDAKPNPAEAAEIERLNNDLHSKQEFETAEPTVKDQHDADPLPRKDADKDDPRTPREDKTDKDEKSTADKHAAQKKSDKDDFVSRGRGPLRAHEFLSEKQKSITVKVSEDVWQAFKDNNRDIEQEASDLLTSQAGRIGWL